MKKNRFFLWPHPQFSYASLFSFASVNDVENAFQEMYTGAVPVVFSSARASISAILELLHMGRASHIWCPPYSSHCVLEAVSRIATPSSDFAGSMSALVYHQWGYIHTARGKEVCIEDAADSFLLPGNIQFPNNGKFQIVSLPKIYGCIGGGVVFCKEGEDAEQLRKIRDTRKSHTGIQFCLKLSGSFSGTALAYWNGAEAGGGRPAASVCREILKGMESTDKLIRDRKDKLDLLRGLAPEWLSFPPDRLPSAVPVERHHMKATQLQMRGRVISQRHFNKNFNENSASLVRVFPIPIHQDFSLLDIEVLKKEIG